MHIAIFHSRRASLATTSKRYLSHCKQKVDSSCPGAAGVGEGWFQGFGCLTNKQYFHELHSQAKLSSRCTLQLVSSLAGTAYYFACHRWLSRDEDDGLIERDLCPGEAESHDLDVQYTAEVFTSDITGAGTDADVSLVLFGHLGNSSRQSLNVSCYAVFCHAVLCCAMLCCAVPYCLLRAATIQC